MDLGWDIMKVTIDGREIEKVSLYNLKYVIDNKIGIGSKADVIFSGDVIPRFVRFKNEKIPEIPTVCPYCGTPLERATNVYCPNKECSGRVKAGVIEFFAALKLEDVSYETLSHLYDKGFDSIEKLLNVKYSDLINLEGYQATKAIKVERMLNNCLKDISITKLMYISQVFMNEKTSLGETKLQWVVDAYGEDNIIASLNGEKDENGKFKRLDPNVLSTIKGFGQAGIQIFTSNYIEFKKLYIRLKPYLTLKKTQVIQGKFSGMIFTFTQFRDENIEKIIIENGGLIKGISKKTSVLFSAGASTKTATAEKYGIPIVPAGQAEIYIQELLERN